MKKNHLLIMLAGVVVVAAAAWVMLRTPNGAPGKDAGTDANEPVRTALTDEAATAVAATADTTLDTTNTGTRAAALTPEEIAKLGEGRIITKNGAKFFLPTSEADKVVRNLDNLLDDEKRDAALAEALRLKTHPDAAVRSKAAFALNWLGVQGLEGLTSMLADPDPEVAKEASDYWKDLLGELESDYDKASLLVAAAQAYGDSIPMDVLEEFVTELQMLDDMNTIAGLKKILEDMKDPAKVALIGEAIDDMAEDSRPDLNQKERLKQADKIMSDILEQLAEEKAMLAE